MTKSSKQRNNDLNSDKENDNQPQKIVIPTSYIAKIRSFSGEEEDEDPQEWIEEVAKAAVANGWTEERTSQIVPYFLKGIANDWYKNLPQKLLNFNDFIGEFVKEFLSEKSNLKYKRKLESIKQLSNESVTKYLTKFKTMVRKINSSQEDEKYFSEA